MSVATSVSYIDVSNNESDSIQTRINTKIITIPASVVEIPDNSFENSIVESIIFTSDSQLKTIGKAAFKNCKFLKSIQIPASVVEIADEAFFNSSLEAIVFTHDSQLKAIGKDVFRDCKFLKSITIPDSVTHIESNSFRNSAIEKVLFGENSQCTIIGQSAFRECSFLKSIEIPSSVLKIGNSAFSNSSIQTLIFADDSRLETIDRSAFINCKSLESMIIPSSVVTIDYAAFAESTIKQVIFSDVSKLKILNDFIFEKCVYLKSIILPASILEIAESAFAESGIEEVLFSDNANLKTIGNYVFMHCQFLKSITIPDSLTHIGMGAFGYATIEDVLFGANSQCTTIGDSAFRHCRFLESIEIPASVLKIGKSAFSDSSIQFIVFTGNSRLETIDKFAFCKCKSLESIEIPSSVLDIQNSAFADSSIQIIVFTGDSRLETIGQSAFRECFFLRSIQIPSSVLKIGDEAFAFSNIQTLIFTDGSRLETIGKLAFENCESLESIKIPSSVVAIGYSAFSESTIKQVIFSGDSRLEILGEYIFEKCIYLKSITLPASILEIGESAFSKSGIEEVLFSDNSNLKTIGKSAFHQTKLSKAITIPDSVVIIAEKAFSGCNKLGEIILSVNSQLETIGEEAFLECSSLKNFIFPQSLREIGGFAFSLCNLPKSITLLSPSVEFLGDPFTKSGVDEIIFGNGEKIQTTEKNNHFLQLCKKGDFSKCKEYLEHNDVNLSYVISNDRYSVCFIEDSMSIAMATKNVDLIAFLIKNKVLMYSKCKTRHIKECFTDDIFESIFFESATVFWDCIYSFATRKMYKFIHRLLELLRVKEYVEEWVSIFKNSQQITPLQCVTKGDSFDLYHFLIDYDLIKLADLEVKTLEIYIQLAFKFWNIAILKKSLEALPIGDIPFNFKDFLMRAPQDKLYPLIEYTLPYILQNEDPFGFIVEGEYEDRNYIKFPETVLSYLAYAQAFDAFKYTIDNVPNTQYTPSHLVACSLFRGYNDAKRKGNVDISNFMKLFDYILQDNIRPHVLGEDKVWIGNSIFTCIEYGSSEMCMRIFSYGFDKDDVYIDVISDSKYSSLVRYSLLSYACTYQSSEVVQFLIDIGVCVDGLLPNHTNRRADSNKDEQNCINIAYEDKDEDEGETRCEGRGEDKHMLDDDSDDDSVDEYECYSDDIYGDVTNPEKYVFMDANLKKSWFEPYFNPYRLNKNQDVEIYYYSSIPFDPSTEDPFKRFLKNRPTGYLTLLNVTPLGAAIYAQNVDLVRLLLKNGANPNAKAFSGFPHLFVLGAGKVIKLHHQYSRESPEVGYPIIDVPSEMEKQEEEEKEELEKGKKMKIEHNSEVEDVSVTLSSVPDKKFAIFQELVNYGADLFHEQISRYVTDGINSIEFNIYELCTSLDYPLNLLTYLQKIPQLGDKIKEYYIDSFRTTMTGDYYSQAFFPANTIDYMFQNGYVHFETYEEANAFYDAIESKSEYQNDLKLVLEKYGFRFANLTNK